MHDIIDRLNDMTKTWFTLGQLLTDSQCVVAMRLMGATGLWSVSDEEHTEMVSEKAPAFTEALVAGTLAALAGRGPDRAMQAAIAPISEKASANRARLTNRGPVSVGLGKDTATSTLTGVKLK